MHRQWIYYKNPEEGVKRASRYFVASVRERSNKELASLARNHWSVENRNHYRRDTCKWLEDSHRQRNSRSAQNLALTHNALLAIIPFDEKTSLSKLLHTYDRNPGKAIRLIQSARPII